jgi:hypothetical protein
VRRHQHLLIFVKGNGRAAADALREAGDA